jgi:uncharacterized delta-60 repeat protein
MTGTRRIGPSDANTVASTSGASRPGAAQAGSDDRAMGANLPRPRGARSCARLVLASVLLTATALLALLAGPKAILKRLASPAMLAACLALVVALGGVSYAAEAATPGDLDPSFGAGGKTTLDLGLDEFAFAVATQPDDKVVVAGRNGVGLPDALVARYEPDGRLDPSFDGDGIQTIPFDFNDFASAVAIQPDGKILVAGHTDFRGTAANPSNFVIGRLTADGAIDDSFGGDGTKTIDLGADDQATAVALQSDRIVVGGRRTSGVDSNFAFVALTSSGALDPSFSGDGVQTVDFGGFDPLHGLAVGPGGRLLAVGSTTAGGGAANPSKFAMVQLDRDGNLDPGFSGDGKQTVDPGADDSAQAVAYQSDGRAIVAGITNAGALADFAAIRINDRGTLDPGFAGDGAQTISFGVAPFNGRDLAESVTVTPHDEIVIAGFTNASATPDDFALAVLNANGTPDTGFSGDGRQTVDFGGIDRAFGVALANGRAYLAGLTGPSTTSNRDVAIASLLLANPTPADGGSPDAPAPAPSGGTAPAPAPSTQPAADRTAPVLSRLRLAPKTFRARRGTKVTFRLSEKARVRLTAQRSRPRSAPAGFARFARTTRTGATGANKLTLRRTIGARRLRPGRYRLTLHATDPSGNKSTRARARFTVKR